VRSAAVQTDAEYERSEATDLAEWAEAEREFSDGPPTVEIPFEIMSEVVHGRRV
jgi:hypothetical protein